jgi:hypothetical protein
MVGSFKFINEQVQYLIRAGYMILSWIHDMIWIDRYTISSEYTIWPESMGTVLNPIATVEIDG